MAKYDALSKDNPDAYRHTPNKLLLYVVHIPDNGDVADKEGYLSYYKRLKPALTLSEMRYEEFGNVIIVNDYDAFMEKVYHTILSM